MPECGALALKDLTPMRTKCITDEVKFSRFLYDLLLIFILAEGIYVSYGLSLGFPAVFILVAAVCFGGGWVLRRLWGGGT